MGKTGDSGLGKALICAIVEILGNENMSLDASAQKEILGVHETCIVARSLKENDA